MAEEQYRLYVGEIRAEVKRVIMEYPDGRKKQYTTPACALSAVENLVREGKQVSIDDILNNMPVDGSTKNRTLFGDEVKKIKAKYAQTLVGARA